MSDVPTMRVVNNRVEIEWPEPRQREYPVSSELLEQIVQRENQARAMEEILRNLAGPEDWAQGPIVSAYYCGDYECGLCDGSDLFADEGFAHETDCAWRQAREFVFGVGGLQYQNQPEIS